jgi:hypothetical protein
MWVKILAKIKDRQAAEKPAIPVKLIEGCGRPDAG